MGSFDLFGSSISSLGSVVNSATLNDIASGNINLASGTSSSLISSSGSFSDLTSLLGGGGGATASSGITVSGDTSTLDRRLRIKAQQPSVVYGANDRTNNILAPLYNTSGLLFPYTPTVQISQDVEWQSNTLVHTNYDTLSYQRTPSANISISGKFTIQNQREAEYAIAAIHFLRTVTKMYFGDHSDGSSNPTDSSDNKTSGLAGLPPPVLLLSGYGQYMFNNLKCVIRTFSMNFDENMNLVEAVSPTGLSMWLPPLFTISVTIALQNNPAKVRSDFYLDDFRTGALMRQQAGWF